ATRAAALLLEARHSGKGLRELPADCRPRSIEEAYAIQAAVAARNGPIRAWKTGAPSPEADASFAPIFTVVASPSRFPAAAQRLFGIEAELAFRMGRDLPPRKTPYARAEVIAAIAAMHPAVELVESRFADWREVDALSKLADNQSNGALVYGPAIPDWEKVELIRPPLTVAIDGAILARTSGNNGGDPLRLLTALAAHCASSGEGLRAGDFVTTGSLMGVVFGKPGAEIVADFGRLGTVRLGFPE
ncbi:MAG: fumarylacetoacetate hydrolase family protein, partial [Alphaproteobacteria bacterium]|nr:fumarylacetoacetate hydrolase family protein [Alphaproteobacteria bacterium]